MSLEVNTGRNNNRIVTLLQNDNCIEMPLSPASSESDTTSSESTSSDETSQETSQETLIDINNLENELVNRYVPPTPLSENETVNPFVIGSIKNILDNCSTSVIPFRDNTNSIVATSSQELQQFDLDCPICFDPLDSCHIITMDCCRKQLHLKCINKWHMKNIDSETKELCIMCRTKSDLMTDIYNTLSLTIYDDDDDDEENVVNNARRRLRRGERGGVRRRGRSRRRRCDQTFQHAICATICLLSIFLFILLLNSNNLDYHEHNYNETNTYHHDP